MAREASADLSIFRLAIGRWPALTPSWDEEPPPRQPHPLQQRWGPGAVFPGW